MRWLRSTVSVAFASLLTCTASGQTVTVKDQLLAQAPPRLLELAKRFPGEPVEVGFLKADLDGTGNFQYVIAFYSQSIDPGSYLRVFNQQGADLKLIGEQEDQETHGGWGWRVELVDIDGDGIPELDLSGTDSSGQQVMHEYFRWTGTSLHELLDPAKEMANDGALEDLDGDGRLTLVVRHGATQYIVYKFNGSDFVQTEALTHDPQGLIGSDGNIHKVRALFAELRPSSFSLDDIKAERKKDDRNRGDRQDEDGKIKFVIGRLRDLNGKPVSVEQADAATIILAQGVRPFRSRVRPAEDNDGEHAKDEQKHDSVLELEFLRHDVLRLLPRLKLTAPLAKGDKISLLAHGTLKDGTRVTAAASALIKGDRDERDHDRDKGRN